MQCIGDMYYLSFNTFNIVIYNYSTITTIIRAFQKSEIQWEKINKVYVELFVPESPAANVIIVYRLFQYIKIIYICVDLPLNFKILFTGQLSFINYMKKSIVIDFDS